MKKKRLFVFLAILCIVLIGWEVAYRLYYDFHVYTEVQSPSEEYTLIIYVASRFDPVSEYLVPVSSSQSDYKLAYVELKNKKGKIIKKPAFICFDDVIIGNIDIDWEKDSSRVYYTKFDYVNLK